MNDSKKYLLWLLLLYCLFRLPILFSLVGGWEEIYRGNIAVELIRGLKLPVWDYIPDSYGLGIFLSALWTTPLFLIFGKTYFALRMEPFLWHFLSLIAWYFVFLPSFSPRQTFIILLFFVFPSPVITHYTLFDNGYHVEMVLWMALSILIFRSFLEGKLSAKKGGLILGLLGGFSSSLIPTHLITQTVIWLSLAFWKGPVQKRNFYFLFVIGFFVGFSPFLLYNININGAGFKTLFQMFFQENPFLHFKSNFFGFFFEPGNGFQDLFGFPTLPHRIGILTTQIYILLYVVSLFLLWKRNRFFWKGMKDQLNIEAFGLMFSMILIFSLIIKIGPITPSRYFFPLVPFLGMALVAAVKNTGWLQRGVIAFCITAGIIGNLFLIHLSEWGRPLKLQGYSYQKLGEFLELKFGNDFPLFKEKFQKVTQGRSLQEKKLFVQGLTGSCFLLKSDKDLQKGLSFIKGEEALLQPILYEKLGMQLGLYTQFDPQKVENLLRVGSLQEKFFPDIYRGVVQGLNWTTDLRLRQMMEIGAPLCARVLPKEKSACYEGLGLLDDRVDFGLAKVKQHEEIVAKLEKDYIPNYIKGVGENLIYDSEMTQLLFASLKNPERNWFLKGIEQGLSNVEDPFMQWEMRQKLALTF